MISSNLSNDLKKEILDLLNDLPMEAGLSTDILELLQQAGQSLAMKIAHEFLASKADKKKSHGKKIAMLVDPEKNVDVILPLLDEVNSLLCWQALHSITMTRKFLEEDGHVVDRVIKVLLEDQRPELRVEAAAMLAYCKTAPRIIKALEYVRDHDFEVDENGYWAGYVAEESLKRIRERQNGLC